MVEREGSHDMNKKYIILIGGSLVTSIYFIHMFVNLLSHVAYSNYINMSTQTYLVKDTQPPAKIKKNTPIKFMIDGKSDVFTMFNKINGDVMVYSFLQIYNKKRKF
jgi:hypothetical protein